MVDFPVARVLQGLALKVGPTLPSTPGDVWATSERAGDVPGSREPHQEDEVREAPVQLLCGATSALRILL